MESAIELCKGHMKQILSSSKPIDNPFFVELVTSVGDLISRSATNLKIKFGNELEIEQYKSSLIFHLCQLISSLKFLAQIISNEVKIGSILKQCRISVYNRINFCLDNIVETFSSDNAPTNQSGCFLKWMDNALEKLTDVDIDRGKESALKDLEEAKLLFEDVLSHGMSIAQMCLDEDSKAIKGSSQSVLESLEELEQELNKNEPNEAMVNLFIDSCGDKLCSLERRIDMAVLRLSLKIFSKYLLPIEKVFIFCEDNCQNQFEQQQIDNIVADFDLHVDRIMQIGLFAVFCSSNIRSGIKIRNCMASLELLEQELIPSALMLLTDDCQVNRTRATLYKHYWIDEATELKRLIFKIIDPSAFCKVIRDDLGFELDIILEKFKKEKDFSKHLYDNIVDLGRVLIDFLSISIGPDDIFRKPIIKEKIDTCCLVLREIIKAIEVLEDSSAETNERILKRCRIFKAEIKKLVLVMTEGNDEVAEEMKQFESNIIEDGDFVENKFFQHIVKRGKDILENRSILYRTPNRASTFQPALSTYEKTGKKKTVDSFIRRLSAAKLNFSFDSSNGSSEQQLFDVHITEILDDLSHLSTTF